MVTYRLAYNPRPPVCARLYLQVSRHAPEIYEAYAYAAEPFDEFVAGLRPADTWPPDLAAWHAEATSWLCPDVLDWWLPWFEFEPGLEPMPLRWWLRRALVVAAAMDGPDVIGAGALTIVIGDGRQGTRGFEDREICYELRGVVVQNAYRGCGIFKRITELLLAHARRLGGLPTFLATSNPVLRSAIQRRNSADPRRDLMNQIICWHPGWLPCIECTRLPGNTWWWATDRPLPDGEDHDHFDLKGLGRPWQQMAARGRPFACSSVAMSTQMEYGGEALELRSESGSSLERTFASGFFVPGNTQIKGGMLTIAQNFTVMSLKLGPARGVVIVAAAIGASWITSRLIDLGIPYLSRRIGAFSDRTQNSQRVWRTRRLETFVGTIAAVLRVLFVGIYLLIAWRLLSPASSSATLIGASALLAIVIGSVLGPLFRDITTGSMMIAEDWYNVGDHIIVVPFDDVRGVVEKLTPRSTKIRSINGEVIWMHNQNIMGARVTARGVRTIALDVFVRDEAAGKRVIRQAIKTVPTGPTMLAGPLRIGEVEKLGDELWRVQASGQTMPGREWLIEDFALNAIKKYDALSDDGPVIVHGPIAHHADATAERKFRRSVRAHQYGSVVSPNN